MVEGLGPVFRGDDRGQFIIADIKFTKKVTVYHVFDSFQFQPCPPRQSGMARSRANGVPGRLFRPCSFGSAPNAPRPVSIRRNQKKEKPPPDARGGLTQASIISPALSKTTAI